MRRCKTVGGLVAALAMLGVTAAGLAQAPATQHSPEVKALIAQGSIVGPTLITLDLVDATPQDIFAEIAKQTGYDIHPYGHNNWKAINQHTVSIRADKEPFWNVILTVCKAANLSVGAGEEGQPALAILSADGGGVKLAAYPSDVSGAFLFIATALQRNNSVDLVHPEAIRRDLSLQWTIFAEPKVKVLQTAYQPELDEAVDNKGNSLKPTSRHSGMHYSSSRGLTTNMVVPLHYPADAGDKIATLRGALRVIVKKGSETFEVPNILKAKDLTKEVVGMQFTINSVKKESGNQYAVDVLITRGSLEPQAFTQAVQNPDIHLVDADGHVFPYRGYSGGGNDQRREMKMRFDRANPRGDDSAVGEPVKLVWEVPTATQEISVPFQFTNLPLP